MSVSDQVVYRHNADWSEMRQLHGGGFLADTNRPDPDCSAIIFKRDRVVRASVSTRAGDDRHRLGPVPL